VGLAITVREYSNNSINSIKTTQAHPFLQMTHLSLSDGEDLLYRFWSHSQKFDGAKWSFESWVKIVHFYSMSEGQAAEGREIPVEARGTVGRGEAGDGANVDSVEASSREDRQNELSVGVTLPVCSLA
jgi:hypothetical protein